MINEKKKNSRPPRTAVYLSQGRISRHVRVRLPRDLVVSLHPPRRRQRRLHASKKNASIKHELSGTCVWVRMCAPARACACSATYADRRVQGPRTLRLEVAG